VWCTVNCFHSEGCSAVTHDIFNVFHVFLVKKHAAFKWKDAISGLPVSPCSAEALVRWGGIIKCLLIAYFLSNIFAKNFQNWFLQVIARQSSVFFGTQCGWCGAASVSGMCGMWLISSHRAPHVPFFLPFCLCWVHSDCRLSGALLLSPVANVPSSLDCFLWQTEGVQKWLLAVLHL